MESLAQFGWTDDLQHSWRELGLNGMVPARVVADFGTSMTVVTPKRITAELSGKLAHYTHREQTPKVGDWVAVRLQDNSAAVVEALLPRRSEIARKVAGKQTAKQILATN